MTLGSARADDVLADEHRALNILTVHNEYLQRGGEDSVLEAERDLLRVHGHRVTVFTRSSKSMRGAMDKLRAARGFCYSEDSKLAVQAEIRRCNPDIVHVHNFVPLLSPSVFDACWELGVPVVQTLHNYRYLCSASTLYRDGSICEDCLTHGPYKAVVHRCYRGSAAQTLLHARMLAMSQGKATWLDKIDRFIAVSQFCKRKYVEAGFDPDRIDVKHNFINPELETPPQERAEAHGESRALFVGRLTVEKGVRTLMRAWAKVAMPLDVVGDGPLLEEARRSSPPNVTFHGSKPRAETLDLMQRAAVLVVPSEWYETFGMVLIEAMSRRLPIVSTNLGGMAELVIDGWNGLQFAPGDSDALAERVNWVAGHPVEARALGDRGRDFFESRFTAAHNYRRIMEIYESIIAEKGSGAGQARGAASP